MSSRKNSLLLKILLLLLIACIALAVGVTYGRYHSSIVTASFNVSSVSANTFGFYGGKLTEETINSEWSTISSGWTQNSDNATLDFFVVNGTSSESFSGRDQTYTVKLISGVSSGPLSVSLSYVDEDGDSVVLAANPERISENSAMYDVYGDGWVYSFLDMNVEEISFLLEGGKLNYRNFKLNVSGEVDPSMFSIYVTSDFVAVK